MYSKSDEKQECVHKSDYNSEQKDITRKQSASVKFTGGFFSPKNRDSVSFSGRSPKKNFWNWLGNNPKIQNFIKSKKFDKILEAGNDLANTESLIMLGISVSIKPLSIMALPNAKEEDKKYIATKAVLSGLVDYVITTATVVPIAKIIEKFGEKVKKDPKVLDKMKYLKRGENMKKFTKTLSYMPKMLLIPVRAALTIALIPPTLKYLFPEEAEKLKKIKKEARK